MSTFPSDRQIDCRIEIVTPENIAFQYMLAGPFRRLPAFMIDLVVRALLMLAAGIVIAYTSVLLGSVGIIGAMLLVWFVLDWLYGGLFELFWNGQTPGKRMLGLRVLQVDGRPINGMQALLRNVLRAADAMPYVPIGVTGGLEGDSAIPILPLFMVGLIAAASNRRFQRLGDLACGTMVIVEEREARYALGTSYSPEMVALSARLPPDVVLSRSLYRALSRYVARRRFFSPQRRREIARPVAELLIARQGLPAEADHDLLLCAIHHRVTRGYDAASRHGPVPAVPAPRESPSPLGTGR